MAGLPGCPPAPTSEAPWPVWLPCRVSGALGCNTGGLVTMASLEAGGTRHPLRWKGGSRGSGTLRRPHSGGTVAHGVGCSVAPPSSRSPPHPNPCMRTSAPQVRSPEGGSSVQSPLACLALRGRSLGTQQPVGAGPGSASGGTPPEARPSGRLLSWCFPSPPGGQRRGGRGEGWEQGGLCPPRACSSAQPGARSFPARAPGSLLPPGRQRLAASRRWMRLSSGGRQQGPGLQRQI